MATMEVKAMKKQLVRFLGSAVLVMAVMFNLLCGCAVEPNPAEEAVMDQDGRCECVGTDCNFVFGDKIEKCDDGVCTPEGCKAAPVSEFETAMLALELDDSIDLKGNCEGNCGPAGVMWCGNATLKGVAYEDRWMCVPYLDKTGKCHMKAVANECDGGAEVCVLDGVYPNYGECKVPPLCVKDADCNDQNQCTTDTCVNGMCKFTLNVGVACEDGNKCTLGDACSAFGTCVSGTLKSCDDKESCTGDTCDPATGNCVYASFPDNAQCDDGNKCTLGDKCANGKCGGAAVVCDDQNACTADSCDALTGQCTFVNVADSTKCDDGMKCTEDDACFAGKCVGQDVDCDDGNVCTLDLCDENQGKCAHNFADDGTDCGTGICVVGVCQQDDLWCEVGDPPCRQIGGELGYWICQVPPLGDGTYGVWEELQHCGPVGQAVCVDGIGCTNPGSQEIACANGHDDDNDGLADCLDPDCAQSPACQPAPPPPESAADCTDGKDNDGDGLVDCADPGCAGAEACQPMPLQCAKDADCGPNEFCGVNGLCYIKVDQHGSTGKGQSGANGGPWPDGSPDSFDNDGDCYCEVVVCTGDANKDGKCDGAELGCAGTTATPAQCPKLYGGDCDDTNTGAANNPGAQDFLGDNFDNNCDGKVE